MYFSLRTFKEIKKRIKLFMSIELDEDKEIMQEINEESIASFLNCSQRNASVFGFKSNNFVAFSF